MSTDPDERWPALPLDEWKDTYATLHRWTQMVGKIRTALTPPINHWWHSTLYVSPRGLTTTAIPYRDRLFEMEFDFLADELAIRVSDGNRATVALVPRTVADFYGDLMSTLAALGIEVEIWPQPVEIPFDAIPFPDDDRHASYDRDSVLRFFRILTGVHTALSRFRNDFLGKQSPVHFFWGSFDLAITRFSGRRAPAREGADAVTREGYSHECSSVGFWPGGAWYTGAIVPEPVFYAYAAPQPEGFAGATVKPTAAAYDTDFSEFILPYDAVRTLDDPGAAILDFARTTYAAAAELGRWDRDALERAR